MGRRYGNAECSHERENYSSSRFSAEPLIRPELRDLGATCEATLFAQQGIDTIVFGPGNIAAAHTKNESIWIPQLEKAAEYYHTLTKEVLC